MARTFWIAAGGLLVVVLGSAARGQVADDSPRLVLVELFTSHG